MSHKYNKNLSAVKNTSVDTSTKPSRNSIISEVKNKSYASTKPELPSRNSISEVKNKSYASTKPELPSRNSISEVKNKSYASTKPELPSRNVPRHNKYIKGGVIKKDEDIELYEEP